MLPGVATRTGAIGTGLGAASVRPGSTMSGRCSVRRRSAGWPGPACRSSGFATGRRSSQGLSDAELRQTGMQLRGRARGGESLDRMLPGGVRPGVRGASPAPRACGRSTCSWRPAWSCTGRPGRAGHRRGQDAHRRPAGLPQRLEGKGVHVTTVNDYLARRDAEWIGPIYQALGLTVGVPAKQMERAGPEPSLPLRHHLRHRLRVRLRFPARPAEGVPVAKGQASPFWAPWVRGDTPSAASHGPAGAARPSLRPGGRGRQHLHRRGQARRSSSAAPTRPASEPRSRSSICGPTSSPGRWAATSISPSTRRSRSSS